MATDERVEQLLQQVRTAVYEAADAAASDPDGWYSVTVWPDGTVRWNVQASATYPADEHFRSSPHPLTVWSVDGGGMVLSVEADQVPWRADPNGPYIGNYKDYMGSGAAPEYREFDPTSSYPAGWQRFSEDHRPTAWDEWTAGEDYFTHWHGDGYWQSLRDELVGWASENLTGERAA